MIAERTCLSSFPVPGLSTAPATATAAQAPGRSTTADWRWTQTVRVQSAAADTLCPDHCHGSNLSASFTWPWNVRVAASSQPFHRHCVSQFQSESIRRMSTFDPATVRKAIAEFRPRRPQQFQDLFPAKQVITELRQKRASYRAIAELLTQHCLPTSKTHIAMFCHQVLGEIVRPYRRPARKRQAALPRPNGDQTSSAPAQRMDLHPPGESSVALSSVENSAGRARGPRIAQVRMHKPQSP